MKLYKLTDQNSQTHNKTQWGEEGITHHVKKEIKNPDLCSGDVIHAYKDIHLAYLLNPIHGGYKNPLCYEAEGDIVIEDWGKVGCYELTTMKQIPKPDWVDSKDEWKVRLRFAILCAKEVQHLNTDERIVKAIQMAENYLNNPPEWTAEAAWMAVRTVEAAKMAARAAEAAEAAEAAARTAKAAGIKIDFIKLAKTAVTF